MSLADIFKRKPKQLDADPEDGDGSEMMAGNEAVRKKQILLMSGGAAIALVLGSWYIMDDDKAELVTDASGKETRIATDDMVNKNMSQREWQAVAPGGKPLSARLHDELAVQRRDILAASILADPGLALDYALFAMVDRNRTYGRAGTTITAGRPNDPQMPADAKPTQAKIAIAEAREALDGSWTEGKTPVERFEAFRALDDDAKASWLAMIVADSLEAKQDYGAVTTNPLHARLAAILEVDVAKWWRPTCANFFDRVSKGTLLATLTEVGGATLAGRYLGSKKGEISTSCERLFAGEAITEAETKEAALAWVPDAMRFDATGATPIEEDTGDDEPSDEEDPADDEDLLEDGDDGDDSSGSGAVNDDAELVAAE